MEKYSFFPIDGQNFKPRFHLFQHKEKGPLQNSN